MPYKVIIVADTGEGGIDSSVLELLSGALALSGQDRAAVLCVVPGPGMAAVAESLGRRYGLDTLALEGDAFRYRNPGALARALSPVVKRYGPLSVCFAHSAMNAHCASRLAVETGADCFTAVERISPDGGSVSFVRSVFNGKLRMRAHAGDACSVITILSGTFPAATESGLTQGAPEALVERVDVADEGAVPTGTSAAEGEIVPIEDAEVIVAAGRGIGAEENLELIRSLAGVFHDAAIGASRPICDNRWLPYAHQVGVTGKTVSPRLYIACGISGSQQHIAGMKGSQMVVAINRDPNAAIFSVADYIVVEDLKTFIPVLIEKAKSM
jgi:electron transfer flavoprotein alpha subunit